MSMLVRFLEKASDKEGIKMTKQRLLSALRNRFFCASGLDIMRSRSYVLPTVLDPRFKVQFLNDKANGKTLLFDELLEHHSHHTVHVEKVDDAAHLGNPRDKVPGDGDEDDSMACFQEIASSYEKVNTPVTIAQKDVAAESASKVERYLRIPLMGRDKCPLQYWKQEKFPLLKQLAAKYLCTSASSVYSECLFSEYGNIFEEKQTRLLPKKGEMLLFIHHNGKKNSPDEGQVLIDFVDHRSPLLSLNIE